VPGACDNNSTASSTASASTGACCGNNNNNNCEMTEDEQITAAVLASLSDSQSSTSTQSTSHSSVEGVKRAPYEENQIVVESKEDDIRNVSTASMASTYKEVEPIDATPLLTVDVPKMDMSRDSSVQSFDMCEDTAAALLNIGEYTANNGNVATTNATQAPSAPALMLTPTAQLIDHVTFPDGARVGPNTTFIKTWRVRNNGNYSWPAGCLIINAKKGDNMTQGAVAKAVPSVAAGEKVDLSLELTAPSLSGRYVAYYQLIDPNGEVFCSNIWCEIVVTEQQSPPPAPISPVINPTINEVSRVTIPATTSTVPTGVRNAYPMDPLAADMLLWGQELESLNNMGFTNVQEVLPLLKHYIKNPCMKTGILDSRGLERVLDALFHNSRA